MNTTPKKREILPFIILAIVGIGYTLVVFNQISGFKQLPSPLYGGDYYHQLGAVYNVMYNTPDKWIEGILPGSNDVYLPFYTIVVGMFGKILGLTPMGAMLYFNILLPSAAIGITFILFDKLLKDKNAALIGTLILVPFTAFPILKYTDFTAFLVIPAFLYTLYLFFESQTIKRMCILGIAYGVLSLSHSTGFIIASFLVFATSLYLILREYNHTRQFSQSVRKLAFLCVIAGVLGFAIAQLYWYNPIFVMHGYLPSRQLEWNIQDFFNTFYQFAFLFGILSKYLFSTSSIWRIIIDILFIAGIFTLFRHLRKRLSRQTAQEDNTQEANTQEENTQRYDFIVLMLFFTMLLTFSYFITIPLLKTHFIPNYIEYLSLRPIAAIIAAIGYIFFSRTVTSINVTTIQKYLVYGFIMLFCIESLGIYSEWSGERWKEVGRAPLPQKILALQSFLIKNTDVNAIVLSSNELGFMINAISGRREIATRRAHTDPFFDFDSMQLIAAKILYGNDTVEKVRLLTEHNISYVFYDNDWISTEWYFDKNGKIAGWFDPLLLFDTPKNREELYKYHISYLPLTTWVDPAQKGPEFRQLDILLITPDNYDFQQNKGVWTQELYQYLKPIWSYNDSATGEFSVLYKVVI